MKDLINELLENSGLNFKVQKEPLKLPDGKETKFFGVVRSDSRECFASTTDRYEIFQNEEMAELALLLSEQTGYEVGEGVAYGNGSRVSIDLKGKENFLEYPKVGDIIQNSIRITNTHNGTGSLRLALGSLVLSCTNGMTRWVDEKSASIRHTTNMRGMLDTALKGFELIQKEEQTFMDEIHKMIGTPVDAQMVSNMIEQVTNVDVNKTRKVGGIWKSEDYSTQAVNKAKSLFDSIKEEIDYKGANVWGLFNGVTHFTTHKAGTDKNRETAKVFGSLMNTDKKAYDLALSLV